MKGRWIILLILSVMCIGMAHAVDVNEGVVFHPTGTYAYYNASENLTDVGNITVTSSSLSFTTGAGTTSFNHDPTATTYYGLRDITINFNDTETSTWVTNVTFSILNEDGDIVGTQS